MANHRTASNGKGQRIVVCSPHCVTSAGFRSVIEGTGEYTVTECANAEALVSLSPESAAAIVIDCSTGIGLDILGKLTACGAGVVLWLAGVSAEFIRQAVDCGVRGILSKRSSLDTCRDCIRQVSAGKLWVDPELSQQLVRTRPVKLTRREGELVGLLTQGLRNKEIAWQMKIAEGTAKAYLTRLYQKTGANDRFELAVFALRNLNLEEAGGVSGDGGGKPAGSAERGAQPAFIPATLARVRPRPE